jgi:hypothetical protein
MKIPSPPDGLPSPSGVRSQGPIGHALVVDGGCIIHRGGSAQGDLS